MPWPKGRKRSKAARKKTSIAMKKYYSNPEARKKTSIIMKKYYSNPAERKRQSIIMKKRYFNSAERKKNSVAMKNYFSSPNARKKTSIAMKKYYSNPANRKKMSALKIKQYKQDRKLIKQIDKTMTEWWHEHPNIRKERSIQVKNLFIKNPEKFSKFLKYGKNPITPHLKTKQGFIVKSKGEQKIANFLFDNKIKSLYESKILLFEKEGQVCVPDFYLPSYKTYIEYYGGFPAAWKKKVMKNKLYKKYKIPCIFITPAELRDLKYYLEGELKRKLNNFNK